MIHLLNLVLEFGLDLNVEPQTYGLLRTCAKGRLHPGKLVFSQLMAYLPMSCWQLRVLLWPL